MLFYNSLLTTLTLLTALAGQAMAATQLKLAVRGELGEEQARLSYVMSCGTAYVVLPSINLKKQWTNLTVVLPQESYPTALRLTFLNDQVRMVQGVRMDRNIFVDMDGFFVNTKLTPRANLMIRGAVYDRWVAAQDAARTAAVTNGGFYWNGDYDLQLSNLIPKPTADELCNDPTTKNIVCFQLKGDFGETRPSETEYAQISYQTATGALVVVNERAAMTSQWQRFAIQAPSNVVITRFYVNFLNDRYWMENGVRLDRNIRLNVSSVEVNHVKIPDIAPYIGGHIYSGFLNRQDWQRVGWVVSGVFAWGGQYAIEVPRPYTAQDPCGVPTSPGGANNSLCMMLKGKLGQSSTDSVELVRVSYDTVSGAKYVAYNALPMSSFFRQVPIKFAVSTENVRTVNLTLLNASGGRSVDVDLNPFLLGQETLVNTTPCLETVPFDSSLSISMSM